MKLTVSVPFRMLGNATEAVRASASAAALDEAQLPPLPHAQLSSVAGCCGLLLCAAALAVALLLLLRWYLDEGGLIPLGSRCVPLVRRESAGWSPAATLRCLHACRRAGAGRLPAWRARATVARRPAARFEVAHTLR